MVWAFMGFEYLDHPQEEEKLSTISNPGFSHNRVNRPLAQFSELLSILVFSGAHSIATTTSSFTGVLAPTESRFSIRLRYTCLPGFVLSMLHHISSYSALTSSSSPASSTISSLPVSFFVFFTFEGVSSAFSSFFGLPLFLPLAGVAGASPLRTTLLLVVKSYFLVDSTISL